MITLEVQQFVYPQAQPVTISFHTWQQRESWIIKLNYKNWQGLGEASPFKPITGDSSEDIIRQIHIVSYLPLEPIYDDFEQMHNYLEHTITSPSLIAAIDMAYHDLVAQIQKIPVYQLYTKTPSTAPNSITIFLQESLEATQNEARRIYKNFPDVPIIKIKLKGNDEDIARTKVISEVFPPTMQYILDANQGFPDPQTAVRILKEISNILPKILLIEEPCAKGKLDDMRYVKENLQTMMVFADESAATFDDAQKVIAAKCAHGINIKLQKAGGIWPGRKIAKLCEKNNIKIMVGAMIEGTLGMTGDAHFAATCHDLVLTDLDTDFDIPQIFQGGAIYQNGQRITNSKPGLGISLDLEKIGQAITQNQLIIIQPTIKGSFF